jgi:hypothetical protein
VTNKKKAASLDVGSFSSFSSFLPFFLCSLHCKMVSPSDELTARPTRDRVVALFSALLLCTGVVYTASGPDTTVAAPLLSRVLGASPSGGVLDNDELWDEVRDEARYRHLSEQSDVEAMAARLYPRMLTSGGDSVNGDAGEADKKQFFHLHHMKTGGTSMNAIMNCALDRIRGKSSEAELNIPFYNLEECGGQRYLDCIHGKVPSCKTSIDNTAVMTYCAPLFQANAFGWHDADAFTVIRDPVDRVWSMFRFRTKSCFKCKPLTDIYNMIDAGTTMELGGSELSVQNCMSQLTDHQTRNLLDRATLGDYATEEDKMLEAVHNVKNRFAIIGLTHELPETARMIGEVAPWMAETLPAELEPFGWDHPKYGKKCSVPHKNASPGNNRCGPDSTHWDLPKHPDEETRAAIIAHNQLDVKVYEAAVEQFELQKLALELRDLERRRQPRKEDTKEGGEKI